MFSEVWRQIEWRRAGIVCVKKQAGSTKVIKHGHAIATVMTAVEIVRRRWLRGLVCRERTLSVLVINPALTKAPKAFSGTFAGHVGHPLDLKPITIRVVCTSMLDRSKTRKVSNRLFTLTIKAGCLGCK